MNRAAVLSLLLVAWATGPRGQGSLPRIDGYPAPGEPPMVKLLEPGSTPRKALRIVVAPGYKQHVDITAESTGSIQSADMSLPATTVPATTTTLGYDVAVTGVSANGDVSYSLELTGISVPSGPSQIASEPQQLNLDRMKGAKAVAVVNNRLVGGVKVDTAAANSQQGGQLLVNHVNSAQSLLPALPDEPVGVGARWEVRRTVARGSSTSGAFYEFLRDEIEVTGISGNVVTVKTTTEGTMPAQEMSYPGIPGGTMRMVGKSGPGNGAGILHLDGLVVVGSSTISSATEMGISKDGKSVVTKSQQTAKVTVTTTK